MKERFFRNRTAVFTVVFVLLVGLVGILAPVIAPNDPYETNILNKFASYSLQYPLGTDQLGRCVLSRMIYGIRPTLGLALLTMFGTISLGAILGIMAGYFRGIVEEVIMRVVDVMLSFPSQIMVFACGGTAGCQRPERHHCKCFHQVGVVCPHDPHGRNAVPRPQLCPVFPLRRNAGAVHPVPSSAALHHFRPGGSGFAGCGLGNHQYFHAVVLGTGRTGPHAGMGRNAQ